MKSIEIKYEIGSKVRIIELEVIGIVKSIWITQQGIEYQVRYFDKAEANTIYFYEDELKIEASHPSIEED